jgi:hypothetical protein
VSRPRHHLGWAVRRLAAAVGLLAVVTVAWSRRDDAGAHADAPAPPAWRDGAAPCRQDTLDHVHHPARLIVLARCAAASGVVRSVRYRPDDGDWEVRLTPDPRDAPALPAVNDGTLVAHVIPTDAGSVVLPARGEHVVLSGAWVLDRNRRRIAEMHPTWGITAVGGGRPRAAEPPGSPLVVTADAPTSRGVGELVRLRVRVGSPTKSAAEPQGQAHVFVELHNADGAAVDWRAATTNTLGAVTVNLLALHVPGRYDADVYASKRGRVAVTHAPLLIRRRAPGNAGRPSTGPTGAVRAPGTLPHG